MSQKHTRRKTSSDPSADWSQICIKIWMLLHFSSEATERVSWFHEKTEFCNNPQDYYLHLDQWAELKRCWFGRCINSLFSSALKCIYYWLRLWESFMLLVYNRLKWEAQATIIIRNDLDNYKFRNEFPFLENIIIIWKTFLFKSHRI